MSLIDILKLNEKDARWLQLEVCREYQKNKCSRAETECKFCHAPFDIEIENGRVTACYDSIRGRCNRIKPKCKYFHPPEHLKQQLLINGKKYLELKNAILRQVEGRPVSGPAHSAHPTHPAASAVGQVGQVVLPQQVPLVHVNPYAMGYNVSAPYFVTPRPSTSLSVPSPYGLYQHAYMPQLKTQSVEPVRCEGLPYPGMLYYKKSVEYKPTLYNPYATNGLSYLKPTIDLENYMNQSKISKAYYGQRIKKI